MSKKNDIGFEDWNNFLPRLEAAYKAKEFVLVIGPKGVGKNKLAQTFADSVGKQLESINFSLRTRESHIIGSLSLKEGSSEFNEGILVRSMRKGTMLNLDELNAAEPDVLIRTDEALDDRRQIVLKEDGGEVIKAHPDWFVIATINPISHAGTKELPPQIVSRFPVRIFMDYPSADVEAKIVKLHTGYNDSDIKTAIELARKLRERHKEQELFYAPSIRETIAFARLMKQKIQPREAARMIFRDVYYQWGDASANQVEDLIVSMWQ